MASSEIDLRIDTYPYCEHCGQTADRIVTNVEDGGFDCTELVCNACLRHAISDRAREVQILRLRCADERAEYQS